MFHFFGRTMRLSVFICTAILAGLININLSNAQTKAAEDANPDLFWMRINAKDKFERTKIAAIGASIESVVDGQVIAIGDTRILNEVKKMGALDVSYQITAEVLKRDAELDQKEREKSRALTKDFPLTDTNFHNYEELYRYMAALAQTYPAVTRLYSIGKTIEGREIYGISIGNFSSVVASKRTRNKPAILFLGTHHAREHLSTEIPLMLANYLLTEYRKNNPNVLRWLDSRVIHIIPLVNPDGSEFDVATGKYQMWRKNRRKNADGTMGVDLNRNYGFGWGGEGASPYPSSDTYRGAAPFSEPETQAVKRFIDSNTNITTLLSFHTFSKLILYPYGHVYEDIPNQKDLQVFKVMSGTMAKWNGYDPQKSSELYLAAGDTTDWAYGVHKIFAFTFELDPGSMWEGGFYPGQKVIPGVFAKNLNPMLYLIENSDNPYKVLAPGKSLGFHSNLFNTNTSAVESSLPFLR